MAKTPPVKTRQSRELIRLAYACATDPLQLPAFLEEYTKSVGAQGSGLVVQDLANHKGSVQESWGFDPHWERKYAEHYAATNVWIQRMGPAHLQPGVVHSSESVIRDDELVRTEFYNDFLRPQRMFHSFGAAITREDDVTAYITSVRGRKAGFFNAAEQELCRELIPHLQASLRIRHRFAGLETQVRQLSSALDHLTQGIVITAAGGRVCFMNRSAEATLRARNGIWIAADGLRTSRAEETLRLRHLLQEAASTVTGNGGGAGGVMQISRPGKRPLKISVSPLAASPYGSPSQAAAILLIAAPPDSSNALDARLLQQWFGFTPAEARLASALVGGKSVKEFAEEGGVSLNTARTHLKSLFAKAGVTRQSALVREVLAIAEQLKRYW